MILRFISGVVGFFLFGTMLFGGLFIFDSEQLFSEGMIVIALMSAIGLSNSLYVLWDWYQGYKAWGERKRAQSEKDKS